MNQNIKNLIKKHKDARIKHLNDPNAFIEFQMPWMMFVRTFMIIIQVKRKILIVFDDMIADIMTNKKFQSAIKELFIRCRK